MRNDNLYIYRYKICIIQKKLIVECRLGFITKFSRCCVVSRCIIKYGDHNIILVVMYSLIEV